MTEYLNPAIALPLALALWLAWGTPILAAWNRNRRTTRKSNR